MIPSLLSSLSVCLKPLTGMISGSVNGNTATKAVVEAAKAVAGEHSPPPDAEFEEEKKVL